MPLIVCGARYFRNWVFVVAISRRILSGIKRGTPFGDDSEGLIALMSGVRNLARRAGYGIPCHCVFSGSGGNKAFGDLGSGPFSKLGGFFFARGDTCRATIEMVL